MENDEAWQICVVRERLNISDDDDGLSLEREILNDICTIQWILHYVVIILRLYFLSNY